MENHLGFPCFIIHHLISWQRKVIIGLSKYMQLWLLPGRILLTCYPRFSFLRKNQCISSLVDCDHKLLARCKIGFNPGVTGWNIRPNLADVDAGVLLIVRPVAQSQTKLLLDVLPAQLHLLQQHTDYNQTCFPFGGLERELKTNPLFSPLCTNSKFVHLFWRTDEIFLERKVDLQFGDERTLHIFLPVLADRRRNMWPLHVLKLQMTRAQFLYALFAWKNVELLIRDECLHTGG